MVGVAVLVGNHAHNLITLHLRLEGTAHTAIRARRFDDAIRLAISYTDFSMSVAVGQAWMQAPQETHSESMKFCIWPGEIIEAKPRPSMVSAIVP